jgi:hypothetical protein
MKLKLVAISILIVMLGLVGCTASDPIVGDLHITGRYYSDYVSQNQGVAIILSGTTSIIVNHGLSAAPITVEVTPMENPTNVVSFWWVDTLTATQFTINVNTDPGISNMDFSWIAVGN